MSPRPSGAGPGAPANGGPLAGLRVLDAGTTIAGPFAGTLFADYGADVIKIEKPVAGDTMRQWTPIKNGVSLWWKVIARNKRLVTLNLSSPKGREMFLELAGLSDIVIENYRPGTLDRWGLGYEELKRANPAVIVVHVSGYGQDGPYASRPGYGTVAEAMSGIPAFTGFPERPPTLSAFPLADSLAGVFAVVGALSALHERQHAAGGEGQEVDVSLYEPLFRIVESQVIGFDQLGIVKERRGNRLDEDSPRNVYPTGDGQYVAISASSDRTFARLAAAIGRPELSEDPRFVRNVERIENDEVLDAIIGEWIAARPIVEVLETLGEADVVAGRIYDIEDIFEDQHYRARGAIIDVIDHDFGTVKMPSVVPRFSRSDCVVRWSGGRLGESNGAVFGEMLGYESLELERLAAEGII